MGLVPLRYLQIVPRFSPVRSARSLSIDDRPITTLQTVFNLLEQEPGRTFAQRPRVQRGEVSMISRVPHASDSLSGKATPDTVFDPKDHRSHRNRDNMLDNFEKAQTLSFLWEGTGRTIGQAALPSAWPNCSIGECSLYG